MSMQKLKKIVFPILLAMMNTVSAAEVGYVKHQFINRTGHECYVNVHQQYSYPIEACVGTVGENETKICDGTFEPHQPHFFLYVICNGLEKNTMVFLKNTYKSQNIEVIWTIDVIKKNLHLNYREHGF